MKIFSVKRMLGLAALGAAVAYVRKQGGVKPAYNNLIAKKDELLRKAQAKKDAKPFSEDVGYTGGSAYGYERH